MIWPDEKGVRVIQAVARYVPKPWGRKEAGVRWKRAGQRARR